MPLHFIQEHFRFHNFAAAESFKIIRRLLIEKHLSKQMEKPELYGLNIQFLLQQEIVMDF